MKEKLLIAFCLGIFTFFGFAQVKTDSAKDDFEKYEEETSRGGIGQVTPTPKPTRTPIKTPTRTPMSRNRKRTPTPQSTPTPIKSVGRPGMKIWLQRQVNCDDTKPFVTVAPNSAFFTGDCVRIKFSLNFSGYLTIVNLGTSGKRATLFPKRDETNLISPRTEYLLPKSGKLRFEGNPGNEQIIFIVSKKGKERTTIDRFIDNINTSEISSDLEVYNRDIVPVVEEEEVYVLTDETKLEDAVIFRITLKHRGRN